MGPDIINVFNKTEELFNNIISTNGGRGVVAATAAAEQHQQPSPAQGAGAACPQDGAPGGRGGDDANKGGAGAMRRQRQSMSLNGRMSIGGLGGLDRRHMSLTSETTFGRAMSGLSALSIDWENMDDFDVNVDHSAGINNDIINGQRQQGQAISNPGSESSGLSSGQHSGGQVVRRSSLRKNLPVNPNGNMFNVSFNM